MNCYLVTYQGEEITDVVPVELPGYDGDAYGDTVPFSVGSNQALVPCEDNPKLLAQSDEARCLDPRMDKPASTTAALAALAAAKHALLKPILSTGGCKAFHETWNFRDNWPEAALSVVDGTLLVIICDGGDFAPLLNSAYEHPALRDKFSESMAARGFECYRLLHFAYGIRRKQ